MLLALLLENIRLQYGVTSGLQIWSNRDGLLRSTAVAAVLCWYVGTDSFLPQPRVSHALNY